MISMHGDDPALKEEENITRTKVLSFFLIILEASRVKLHLAYLEYYFKLL